MESKKDIINLEPEIKWRSMISFFLNYITTIDKVMNQELDKEVYDKLIVLITREFWAEQAQAFIELFDLKPGNIKDVHIIKRLIANLLDMRFITIKDEENEIIDVIEQRFCTIRVLLKPVLDNICVFCERWGQIIIDQLDPNFKHEAILSKNTCTHKTTRR